MYRGMISPRPPIFPLNQIIVETKSLAAGGTAPSGGNEGALCGVQHFEEMAATRYSRQASQFAGW
jgi:hypothetical protein